MWSTSVISIYLQLIYSKGILQKHTYVVWVFTIQKTIVLWRRWYFFYWSFQQAVLILWKLQLMHDWNCKRLWHVRRVARSVLYCTPRARTRFESTDLIQSTIWRIADRISLYAHGEWGYTDTTRNQTPLLRSSKLELETINVNSIPPINSQMSVYCTRRYTTDELNHTQR